jgi:hypothetical protein
MIFVGHRRSQPSLPSYTTRPLPYFVPNICSGTLQLSVRLADPAGSPPGARLPDLDILRNGIDATLLGLGHSSTTELTPDDLIIPNGFNRNLGTAKADSRNDLLQPSSEAHIKPLDLSTRT